MMKISDNYSRFKSIAFLRARPRCIKKSKKSTGSFKRVSNHSDVTDMIKDNIELKHLAKLVIDGVSESLKSKDLEDCTLYIVCSWKISTRKFFFLRGFVSEFLRSCSFWVNDSGIISDEKCLYSVLKNRVLRSICDRHVFYVKFSET